MSIANTNPFSGMDEDQLKQALASAQQAYIDLMTGNKGVTFSYTQGDGGTKTVSYKPTDQASLMVLISQLKKAIDPCSPIRRPIRPVFG